MIFGVWSGAIIHVPEQKNTQLEVHILWLFLYILYCTVCGRGACTYDNAWHRQTHDHWPRSHPYDAGRSYAGFRRPCRLRSTRVIPGCY